MKRNYSRFYAMIRGLFITSLAGLALVACNGTEDLGGMVPTNGEGALLITSPSMVTSEDGTSVTFQVRLSAEPDSEVVVTITSSDVNGDEGTLSTNTLQFFPTIGDGNPATVGEPLWYIPQSVTVTGVDDPVPALDGDQRYTLTLVSLSQDLNFNGDTEILSVKNLDNELGLVLSPAGINTWGGSDSRENGRNKTIYFQLDVPPVNNIVMNFTSSNPNEATVSPASYTISPASYNTLRTITVTPQDDMVMDGPQDLFFTIDFSASPDAGYAGLAPVDIPWTNYDDDTPIALNGYEEPPGGVRIPDPCCGSSGQTWVPLDFSGVPSISDVNVMINLDHTYDADLLIYLQSPSGTMISLSYGRGGSANNYIDTIFDDEANLNIWNGSAPFTGRFSPEEPLSTFDGENPNGTWWLYINDRYGGDIGTVWWWGLEIN